MGWLGSLQAAPLIRESHQHFESLRAEEMERAMSKIPELSDEAREKLNAVTPRVVKELLHIPTTQIKRAARQKDGSLRLGLAGNAFGLESDDKEERRA